MSTELSQAAKKAYICREIKTLSIVDRLLVAQFFPAYSKSTFLKEYTGGCAVNLDLIDDKTLINHLYHFIKYKIDINKQ